MAAIARSAPAAPDAASATTAPDGSALSTLPAVLAALSATTAALSDPAALIAPVLSDDQSRVRPRYGNDVHGG